MDASQVRACFGVDLESLLQLRQDVLETAGLRRHPIPVADILPITATQAGLITGIVYLSGRELSKDVAKECLVALGANPGAAFALRELAWAVGKIAFPVAGEISAGGAAAGTWGIGEAAIAYFIENRPIDTKRTVIEYPSGLPKLLKLSDLEFARELSFLAAAKLSCSKGDR